MMFSLLVIVLLAGAGDVPTSQPAKRPATQPDLGPPALRNYAGRRWIPTIKDMTPPGSLGFAVYRIFMYRPFKDGDDDTTVEKDMLVELYDADMKSIGIFHRGDPLPKPFQDWRFVGVPLGTGGSIEAIFTNVMTKETVEMPRSQVHQ